MLKRVVAMCMCYYAALVPDKPLGAPASVKRVYWSAPMRTPSFPPGTHYYDSKRRDLMEGVSKCMIARQKAQARFDEYRDTQRSHDEVDADDSNMNKRLGQQQSSTAISRMVRQPDLPASNCAIDYPTTTPLLLRLHPSYRHWIITCISIWAHQFTTMG